MASPTKRGAAAREAARQIAETSSWADVNRALTLQSEAIKCLSDSLERERKKVGLLTEERDALRCMLSAECQVGQDPVADKQRRRVVLNLAGGGHDFKNKFHTFHRNRTSALTCIKALCGDDTLKQQQLAESLHPHHSTPESSAELMRRKNMMMQSELKSSMRHRVQWLQASWTFCSSYMHATKGVTLMRIVHCTPFATLQPRTFTPSCASP